MESTRELNFEELTLLLDLSRANTPRRATHIDAGKSLLKFLN